MDAKTNRHYVTYQSQTPVPNTYLQNGQLGRVSTWDPHWEGGQYCGCWPIWFTTVNIIVTSCHWWTTRTSWGARGGKHINGRGARRELGITWYCFKGLRVPKQWRKPAPNYSRAEHDRQEPVNWRSEDTVTYMLRGQWKMCKVREDVNSGRPFALLEQGNRQVFPLRSVQMTNTESKNGNPDAKWWGTWRSPLSRAE